MTRTLSTAVSNLLDDELVKPFLAVKLPFPSGGTLRLWTGHGDITVDSETYSGAGQFLGISIVEESEEVKATRKQINIIRAIFIKAIYKRRPTNKSCK
jgi:hypothetical protein